MRWLALAAWLGVFAYVTARQPAPARDYTTWAAYGGGPEQIRYSSLDQINAANVERLGVAWTFDTGEAGQPQTQPVVVDGVLYGLTPTHKALALRAATGEKLWTFDAGVAGSGPNRGVMFWASGGERRVFVAVAEFIYALDAASGKPITTFGTNGRIDLRDGLDRDPATQSVRLTSPGVIYRDLLIVGGRVGETLPTSPGDIRAYDARTGATRWTFHTIPRPGEFGYATWPRDAWTYGGGANNWAGMALDERRGIVYIPTGSAATDFYGVDRLGDNLFANTLLALDASTGRRLWHFQFVRHDVWDRDLPSPPSLVTLQRDGKTIDAVAQATKQGQLFLFDRVTGALLSPIEYRDVPASTVPGEKTAAAQPFAAELKPFARQRLTEDLLTARTPEMRQWALDQFRTMRSGAPFTPLAADRPTVVFPGFDGGANWGGQAFDPATTIYYVNANDLAWTGSLAPSTGGQSGAALYRQHCAECHRDDRRGSAPDYPSLLAAIARFRTEDITGIIRRGRGRMPSFAALPQTHVNAIAAFVMTGQDTPAPAASSAEAISPLIDRSYRFTGYRRFLDPEGFPATAPPWGTLSAIDLNTGEYAWQIPLGEYPALVAKGVTNTGSENYGGPIVTAGGLVFIAATIEDHKIRAFDKKTGALLWQATLPAAGRATPATFQVNGRQFVVIAAGGKYVAFALPR